jgi:hypothetical protein
VAAADTAKLIASLELQDKFSGQAKKVEASLGRMESRFGKIGGIAQKGVGTAVNNIKRLGLVAGVAVAGALTGAVVSGIRSLEDLQRTTAQTAAVIASTGGKAGVSARQVREYAESLENVSTVDDKVIQDGENMLLTFTGIGKDVFPRATKAMLNMAVAMAGGNVEQVDLKASAIQLGKALNDPVKGMTALRKVGVAFTEDQQKQIKALVKSGDVLGAQTIILKELETEFGNAAKAAGTGPGAAWRRLQGVGEDLSQSLARGLLPVLTKASEWLSKKLADPAVIRAIDQIGQGLGRAGEQLFAFIQTVDFKSIADALGTAVGFAGNLVHAFMGMPSWVQAAVITGWGLNKLTGGALTGIVGELGKGLIKGVLGMNAGVVNINAATVNGGVPGVGAAGGLSGIQKMFLVGEAIGLALLVNQVRNGIAEGNTQTSNALVKQTHDWLAQNPSKDDLKNGLGAVESGIKELASSNLPLTLVQGESLTNLREIRGLIINQLAQDEKTASQIGFLVKPLRQMATDARIGFLVGPRIASSLGSKLAASQAQLHSDLQEAIAAINSEEVKLSDAMDSVVKAIRGGAGNSKQTQSIIDQLKKRRDLAAGAGDKKLADEIAAQIRKLEPFAKGRQWQAEQIAKAQKVVDSNKTTADKVAALKGIQSDLLAHQRTMAASIVAGLANVVAAVKAIRLPAGQTPRVNSSTGFVTGGVQLPKSSSSVNSQTGFVINANVTTSTRDVNTAQNIRSRIGPTPTQAGAA